MPGARILPLKGVGKRNAAAALGLVLQPPCPCTRQLLAQAGCQLKYRRPILGAPCLPHDDRARIEIQILDPQLQTSLIRMPVPYRSWAHQTMLAFPENRGCEPLYPSAPRQAPGRLRSSGSSAGRSAHAPAVEEQQGRQCLTMRGDRNLALVRQPGQKCLDFAAASKVAGVTHTVETDEGTNPVDMFVRLVSCNASSVCAHATGPELRPNAAVVTAQWRFSWLVMTVFLYSLCLGIQKVGRYAVGRCLMLWSSNDVTQQGSRPKTKLCRTHPRESDVKISSLLVYMTASVMAVASPLAQSGAEW